MKIISIVIFVVGIIISAYGAIGDDEPITAGGAFLIVTALILYVAIDRKKK